MEKGDDAPRASGTPYPPAGRSGRTAAQADGSAGRSASGQGPGPPGQLARCLAGNFVAPSVWSQSPYAAVPSTRPTGRLVQGPEPCPVVTLNRPSHPVRDGLAQGGGTCAASAGSLLRALTTRLSPLDFPRTDQTLYSAPAGVRGQRSPAEQPVAPAQPGTRNTSHELTKRCTEATDLRPVPCRRNQDNGTRMNAD